MSSNDNLNQKLWDAAKEGDVSKVNESIKAGGDINWRDEDSWPVLVVAASKGHVKVVQTLLDNGANISNQTDSGLTALKMSQYTRHIAVKNLLIDHEMKKRKKFNTLPKTKKIGLQYQRDLLHQEAIIGEEEAVKMLLLRGFDIDEQDEDKNTALHLAAREGKEDIVNLLLSVGANSNIKNSMRQDPSALARTSRIRNAIEVYNMIDPGVQKMDYLFRRAVSAGQLDLVQIFISRGINVEKSDNDKTTPLHLAVRNQNFNVANTLIEKCVNISQKDGNGNTALHLAVENENDEIVKLLVKYDINTECKNLDGNTALHLAVQRNNEVIVRILGELVQNFDVKNHDRNTALHLAVEKENEEIVKYLTEKTKYIDTKNARKDTPLHLAIKKENRRITHILLKKAHPETDMDLNTSLHLAVERENVDIVRMLVEQTTNIDIRNQEGNTALFLAVEARNNVIIQIMMTYGACVYKMNNKGLTPLDEAILSRNNKVIKILLDNFLSASLKDESLYQNNEFLTFLGREKEMFFLRRFYQDISLLSYIIDQGITMLKEREELLDLMKKIDEIMYPSDKENSEFRVTEQLKLGLPSSSGLDECIKSVQQRYSWSEEKLCFMRFLSIFKNVILGWSLYFMDFGTDINFTLAMFNNANKNFTVELQECKQDFKPFIDSVFNFCKADFNMNNCYNALRLAGKNGKVCFENEKRFNDPEEWHLAGIVAMIHCVAPIGFALFVFLVSLFHLKDNIRYMIPLSFITKLYRACIEWKFFAIFTKKDNEKEYSEQKGYWLEILELHEKVVTLSMTIEASLEACFQFWFQTIYLLPSLILGIMDINGANEISDLVNYRTLSIFMSFLTFALASIIIR